jgi:hypothetical protein
MAENPISTAPQQDLTLRFNDELKSLMAKYNASLAPDIIQERLIGEDGSPRITLRPVIRLTFDNADHNPDDA